MQGILGGGASPLVGLGGEDTAVPLFAGMADCSLTAALALPLTRGGTVSPHPRDSPCAGRIRIVEQLGTRRLAVCRGQRLVVTVLGEVFAVSVDECVVLLGLLRGQATQRQPGDCCFDFKKGAFAVMPVGHAG
ncbi:hypothetical protein SALCHL_006453 [Streptomyces albus subsp. chlorinus]|uniref:hypothetical protein n=1 Tax=Streptomyces albus TaxID=1888 RepID=UPI001A9A91EA